MKFFVNETVTKNRRRLTSDAHQIVLGLFLIVLGFIVCAIFWHEDATAGAFLVVLGALRVFFRD